jgi:4-amino-4-deoxy-L-arabinose transferase-like glycosyltransferase
MRSPALKVAAQWLPRIIAISAAVFFMGMYFATALPRLVYPYDLDFLEDSVLMESVRFANNQPVYAPPNVEFNPHVYMPLYFWLGALLFKLGGPSLLLLRSLSLTATLTTTIVIFWIAKRESGRHWIAVCCAGLFLGGYGISGYWYELARVDSLFVTLTLCGLAFAFYANGSNRKLILSAAVLALAAFTKQTGFVIGAGLALYLFIINRQQAGLFAIVFGGLTVIPVLVLNTLTNGWFFYHVFHIGGADPIEMSRLVSYIKDKVFGVMAGLSLMTLLAILLGARRAGLGVLREQPWFIGIGIAIVISGLGRIRVGGNLNDLMPAYTLICLAPALLIPKFEAGTSLKGTTGQGIWVHWQEWLVAAFILAQFRLGAYSPLPYILPTPAMRQSGDRLIQRIASFNGPVFVMMHPYYTLLAGKEPSTQIATLWYVRYRGALPLTNDIINRIKNKYYTAIISDESFFETQPDLHALITTYYFPAQTLDISEAPFTNTGVVVRPDIVYLPDQP